LVCAISFGLIHPHGCKLGHPKPGGRVAMHAVFRRLDGLTGWTLLYLWEVSVARSRILLESGTNEMEIAVVSLGEQAFGINVAKIREFKDFQSIEVSHLPSAHPSVMGVFEFRGDTVPLIDLKKHLNLPVDENKKLKNVIVVVTEFNNTIAGFFTDGITDIHRMSWEGFKPLNRSLAVNTHHVVGSVNINDSRVLVLDMEQILGEIYPESIINYDETKLEGQPTVSGRDGLKVFFAEDSTVIRQQLTKILKVSGYGSIRTFVDGLDCYNAIKEAKQTAKQQGLDITSQINILISDIEMPNKDGLALCREVRHELGLDIPVVMFSSLINEQMAAKCQQVGANEFVSKPETERLMKLIDSYCLSGGA
jgi:two-component system chemotaxis response regulator CheV